MQFQYWWHAYECGNLYVFSGWRIDYNCSDDTTIKLLEKSTVYLLKTFKGTVNSLVFSSNEH